jgi:pimeloyl-ACP methyl ester carboxylesterase
MTEATDTNELRIHCVDEGEGPLILLLHGFPEFSYSWRKVQPQLAAAGFRALAIDLPGYGESSKPRGIEPYGIPSLVAHLANFISGLSAQRPIFVVGHDWGGFIAWYLAMLHPELVEKLVILNVPHPVPYARVLRQSIKQKVRSSYQLFFRLPLLPELVLRAGLPALMKRMGRFTADEILEYRRAWRTPGTLTSMLNYYRAFPRSRGELGRAMRRIDCPVLMIWGKGEPVFTRATTEDFGEWVPNLRFERVPHAGHFVQTDAPERVSELIVEFLRNSDGPRST